MPILDQIARERLRLADLLDTLTPEQALVPSLCGEWTVRQVAAHLLMPLVTPRRTIAVALLRARGNFDRANDQLTRQLAARTSLTQISAGLRRHARSAFHPPGFTHQAPLTELVLHGQDMRRPLGLPVDFGPDVLRPVLDLLVLPRAQVAFVPRGRLRNLHFRATDLDWESGDGELVSGPGAALAYAMSGRAESLGELDGPGVGSLSAR